MTATGQETVHLCGEHLPRPGHVCAFFDSREQEYSVVLPYLREGVLAGEDVLNVLDADRLDDHRSRLAAADIRLDDGRVSIASAEETYLDDGRFDMERMSAFVEDTVATSRAQGRRVRTAGWMGWMQAEAPGCDRVMEYESRMNLLVPKYDCTFLCVYDLAQLGGPTVVGIISTHPWVILNGQIRRNPKYIPPEIYLADVLRPKPLRAS
jgi:hypothetical protein